MTIWLGKRLKELDQLRDATVNEGLTAHVMPNQAFGSDETVLRDDEIEIVKEPVISGWTLSALFDQMHQRSGWPLWDYPRRLRIPTSTAFRSLRSSRNSCFSVSAISDPRSETVPWSAHTSTSCSFGCKTSCMMLLRLARDAHGGVRVRFSVLPLAFLISHGTAVRALPHLRTPKASLCLCNPELAPAWLL